MERKKGLLVVWLASGTAIVAAGACSDARSGGSDALDDAGTTSANGYGGAGGGPGPGAGGGYGGGSGPGVGGGAPIAPSPRPPEDPEDVDCADLDPTQSAVLYISADDSNSTGSPAWARERILAADSPAGGIRTYEFLNYYTIAYPPAPLGQVAIYPQMKAGADPGTFDLQIGVRSFDAVTPRRPMTITFVLDTSGSMGGQGIERERAVVKAIAQSLAEGDIVNAVTWNTANAVVLAGHVVTGPNDATVVAMANALEAGGGTDLHGGLEAGYALATQHYGELRLNRVVLISDGGANVGITDENLIAQHSEDADKEGIYLVGVGAASGGYNDLLMDVVTDEGRGAYVYIDSAAEAQRMFVDRFDEVMEVAARGVQIELTLPWYFQMHEFYGEEYSENPDEVKPQHLAPSDAMIFNQVLKACDPAVVVGTDPITVVANWETPLTYQVQSTSWTTTVDELLGGPTAQLDKGSAIVAYAEALKTGNKDDLDAALTEVQAANPNGTDVELDEIASLIQAHPGF
jgi:Ca-activated chloride channel family protein